MTPARGRFVVLEGGEGAGKSTQAARLARRLDAVLTHEPGDTELGARLRDLVLGTTGPLDDRAEALLMMADRAQHVREVIEPALVSGRDVVCDRFSGSTVAYQGYGRGEDVGIVAAVSAWAANGLEPDLVLWLDVDRAVAGPRIGSSPDRIEAAGDDFHRRVAAGFAELCAEDPERWVRIDANGSVDDVSERVDAAVDVHLGPGR